MDNDAIASPLQETADLIELTNGNPYRARAFRQAARRLRELNEPVADRLREGTLTDLSDIGDAMADHVADIVETGTFPLHDELLNAVPPGLLDMLRVNGLGIKRTRRLWQELGITSLNELEEAAEENRIETLDGFGSKTQQSILENARRLRTYESKWRLAEAWSAASSLLEQLRSLEFVSRAEATGPLRRRLETVDRVDLLVASSTPDSVRTWLKETLSSGVSSDESVFTGTLAEGLPLRLRIAPTDRFGIEWWRTTGSDGHRRAYTDAFGDPGPCANEKELFATEGLPFIPPELRENRGEVEAAARDDLPSLITTDDLRGSLHNHSTYSDGADSLREMATAAQSMGLSYFGICDHSQSLRIADGLSPDEVRAQHDEIQAINDDLAAENVDFRVFAGIESDILTDGSLDYEADLLDAFDFVVASVHTGFSMTEDEATERVVRAVRHPHTRILGHPTGRLLLSREGYPLNHERVIEACAEEEVALELNANPYRLDLDWRWIRTAINHDVLISINPDAHSTDELENVQWGVAVARKGWLTADQCLNAKSRSDFATWLDAESPPA